MIYSAYFVLCALATSAIARPATKSLDLDSFLSQQSSEAITKMFANIHPEGTAPGAIAAATSHEHPNYWYTWTRDSALVMSVVGRLYNTSTPGSPENKRYEQAFWDYAALTKKLQGTANPSTSIILEGGSQQDGEPKFMMDGTAFWGSWGRPQNDGPALRAATLMDFAHSYVAQTNDFERVKRDLYNPTDLTSPIKLDLEFVSHNWQVPSFDLWEEVQGDNFYSRSAQQGALTKGALFARNWFNDTQAATWYSQQATSLTSDLDTHWDPKSGQINACLNRIAGLDYKTSNLDVETLLAAFHSNDSPDNKYAPWSDAVLSTSVKLSDRFKTLYPINSDTSDTLAPAIGRYAEDTYSGYESNVRANPWYLATAAYAETYYRTLTHWATEKKLTVTDANKELLQRVSSLTLTSGTTLTPANKEFKTILQGLYKLADAYMARFQKHADTNSWRLSEQFNLNDGIAQGATDLTWSYASVITANWARQAAQAALK